MLSYDHDYHGVDIVKFGHTISEIVERLDLRNISILKRYDEAISIFDKYYKPIDVVENSYRSLKEQIPFLAYRESLSNAIIRRNYRENQSIKISFYDNRIEVFSPGGLPDGVTINSYLSGQISVPRNPLIAQVFYTLGIIEKFGTGVKRIIEAYNDYSNKPKFIVEDYHIKIILPNVLFNDCQMMPDQRIMNYLDVHLDITRGEIETLLSITKG